MKTWYDTSNSLIRKHRILVEGNDYKIRRIEVLGTLN